MNNYLVFDWGGTMIKYALMDKDAHILNRGEFRSPKKTDKKETFIHAIDQIVSSRKNIQAIAISSPGIIDSSTGTILTIGAFPYLRSCNIKQEFEQRYHVPCAIENDAKCAALAELWQGNLKGIKDGAVWIIGTAIGGGIILDGRLRRGKDFFAGEFSGMYTNIYHENDPLSYCAQLGTRTLCQLVQKYCSLSAEINGIEAFQLINSGNSEALKALTEYTDLTAREIFSINLLLNLQKICIGGGISSQPILIKSLRESVLKLKTYHMDIIQGTNLPLPDIDVCAFHNDANLIGALYHMLYES